MADSLRSVRALTWLIAALAVIATLGGLLVDGLYRDNTFVAAAWRGNDWVTSMLAVPLLVASSSLAMRGSLRAHLVWLGMLDYMLYDYAFYAFGAAFNELFLVYVAIVAAALLALIFGLASLDVDAVARAFTARAPVRWVAGYLLVVAVGLACVYVAQSLAFVVTGELPAIVTRTEHPTSIVFALDLTLLVPFLALGGVWLWRRRPWGYALAVILSVKGPVYTLVLWVGSIWAYRAGIEDALTEVPLWATLTAGGTLASVSLLRSMNRRE